MEFKIYDILSSLIHGVICLGTAMQLFGWSFQDYGEIFNCATLQQVFRRHTLSEVIAKLKAYEEKKADDEIKVGDEVKHKEYKNRFVVTKMF